MKSTSQQITELLGPPHCWHEQLDSQTLECKHCGQPMLFPWQRNPNYEDDAGAIALLRVMMGREDSHDFFNTVGFSAISCFIKVNYLTTPGLLAKTVLDWLKGRKKC